MKVSPSQFALYAKCPLAWFNKYARRLPEMPRKRKGTGDDSHAMFAAYLESGIESPTDPLFLRAKPLLERPADTVIQVEVELSDLWLDDVALMLGPELELVGRMDAVYFRQQADRVLSTVTVVDHKTHGESGKKYLASGKPGTKHWIGDDIQMLCYAAALQRMGNYSAITVRHNQIPTYDAPARKIEATLDEARLQRHWAWMETVARAIQGLRQEGAHPPLGVWLTTAAGQEPCRSCDFAGLCGGSENEEQYRRRAALPEQDDGDVFA